MKPEGKRHFLEVPSSALILPQTGVVSFRIYRIVRYSAAATPLPYRLTD